MKFHGHSMTENYFAHPETLLFCGLTIGKRSFMQDNKSAILAQKETRQEERKTQLRWLVGLSTLPLLGMAVAFGIAPATDPQPVELKTVIENVALPQSDALNGGENTFWREERIQRGDTVANLLDRLEVHDNAASNFLRATKEARTLYQLLPGRTLRARTNEDGELLALRYIASDHTLLKIDRTAGGFHADEQPAPMETHVAMRSGEIQSSLFGATDAAGVPDPVAIQMADIFSSDIDFHLDIRKGDRFTVVYETLYSSGELIKTGRVLAAEFVNQGKTYRAIYFRDPEGRDGYYTPDGKNLRKAFLRSPLEFSRVTSGFSLARFHPILKTWRAHKGVDYGAPIGTKVRATADGNVAFVGQQHGYGNVIILQHNGSYSTVYGHLSRFAKGLHRGSRVQQGDTIGYVGMSGMATGPHLHYEFRVAGIQRNPLTVPMPQAFPIAAKYKNNFLTASTGLTTRLDMARGLNLASID
jgi:murein DD-endopeptidase MepM/ murein hydrolase activator NlpD